MSESDTLALYSTMIDRYFRRTILGLFHLWILVVPFIFTAANDELFEFNKMLFTYAITLLIGGVWITRMIIAKKIIWQKTILFWPILAYMASHILATVFSIHPHTSIFGYYSRFHGGLLSTLTYTTLFFALISNVRWSDIPNLIRTSLIATLGICLYAIPEHFGVSPSCILITGEYTASCWVQDVQTRVFATFGQPNWLAAYLLMMVPLAWWYAGVYWKKWRTASQQIENLVRSTSQKTSPISWDMLSFLLGITVIVLSTLTLLYTRSRSGFLALFLELACLVGGSLWIFWKQRSFSRPIPFSFLMSSLVGIGVVFVIIGTPFSPSLIDLSQRVISPSTPNAEVAPTPIPTTDPAPSTGTVLENGGTDSGTIRKIVWEGALRVWQRYPLFGSGLETFAYSYYRDRPMEHNLVSEWDFLYNRAHNEFLNILATTGAVGFLATLTLMMVFIGGLFKDWFSLLSPLSTDAEDQTETADAAPHREWLPEIFLLALLAGYAGLALSNFFGFSTVVVGTLFFFYKAWWTLWRTPDLAINTDEATPLIAPPATRSKKKKQKYMTKNRSNASRATRSTETVSGDRWMAVGGVGLVTFVLLMHVWGMWQNDHLLALSKGYLSTGSGLAAYNAIQKLVQRAPLEPTYVDQQSVTLARLAAGTSTQDATAGAVLAEEAVAASDRAVALNPVHLNFWKNRARIFIMLAVIDPTYYQQALEALQTAQELAPTDVKLTYNTALVLEALNDPSAPEMYVKTLQMKPDYEAARNSYGQFLERQGDYAAALDQYHYVIDHLNPTAPTALERIEALTATPSAPLQEEQ